MGALNVGVLGKGRSDAVMEAASAVDNHGCRLWMLDVGDLEHV